MEFKKYSKSKIFQLLLVILPFLAIGLIFSKAVFVFFMMIATIGLAFVILFFQPIKHMGIELVTFTTILVGFVWGPTAGMTVGFFLLILHLVIGRYAISTYLVWTIPEYVIIGFLAGTVKTVGFVNFGIIISITVAVLNSVLTFLLSNHYFFRYLPYAVGNA
ncbi:MAG: hypothetical protein V1944_01995, partial [Candidatus Aenigmatarchaeota archaeon]